MFENLNAYYINASVFADSKTYTVHVTNMSLIDICNELVHDGVARQFNTTVKQSNIFQQQTEYQ